jgi:hypothetical protein
MTPMQADIEVRKRIHHSTSSRYHLHSVELALAPQILRRFEASNFSMITMISIINGRNRK